MFNKSHKRALCTSSSVEWLCDVRPVKTARPTPLSPAAQTPQARSPVASRSSPAVRCKGKGRELVNVSEADENASPTRRTDLASRKPPSSQGQSGQQALGFKVGKSIPFAALVERKNGAGRPPEPATAERQAADPTKGYQPPPSPTPIVRTKLTTKEKAQLRAREQKERERAARAVKERAKTGGGLRGWLSAGLTAPGSKSK